MCHGPALPWSGRIRDFGMKGGGIILGFPGFFSYLSAFLLGACRLFPGSENPPTPISQRVMWEGRGPSGYMVTPVSGVDSQSTQGAIRIHVLEFAGSDTTRLTLEEFGHACSAFAAFQENATASEFEDGFFRRGNAVTFHHGKFMGSLPYASAGLLPSRFLQEKLAFQGESLFLHPPEFESFPLLGRIPRSERVISRDFLGRTWRGPVFTVGYRCHDDTATAFRAFAQNHEDLMPWLNGWKGVLDTLDWDREIHFQGWDEFHHPLIFWFFKDAVIGLAGCYDPILARDYAQKMGKTRVFWTKP